MPGFYVDKKVPYKTSEYGHTAILVKNKHRSYSVSTPSYLFIKNSELHSEKAEIKDSAPDSAKASAIHAQYNAVQLNKPIPLDTAIHEVGDKVIQKRAKLSKEYGLISLMTTLGAAGLGYLSLLVLSISFFDIMLMIGFFSFLIMTILLIIDCFRNAHYVRHSKWAHIDDKNKATFGMIMGIASLIIMFSFGGLLLLVLAD